MNEAIRRRIALVPFAVQIPEGERDQELTAKLQAEWPGILRWMIVGAVAWYASGLQIPEPVRETTQQYLDDQNILGQWAAERTKPEPRAFTSTKDLYADWCAWCEARKHTPGPQRVFSDDLTDNLGWERDRTKKRRGFAGVALTDPAQSELNLKEDDSGSHSGD